MVPTELLFPPKWNTFLEERKKHLRFKKLARPGKLKWPREFKGCRKRRKLKKLTFSRPLPKVIKSEISCREEEILWSWQVGSSEDAASWVTTMLGWTLLWCGGLCGTHAPAGDPRKPTHGLTKLDFRGCLIGLVIGVPTGVSRQLFTALWQKLHNLSQRHFTLTKEDISSRSLELELQGFREERDCAPFWTTLMGSDLEAKHHNKKSSFLL